MASGFHMRGMEQLAFNVATFDERVQYAVGGIVDYHGAIAEGEMKRRAPWTDRTAAARTGLHTSTFNEYAAWVLVLAHAVNYGIWLETRNDFNGRYAVILPVMVDIANALMASLEGLFGKMA